MKQRNVRMIETNGIKTEGRRGRQRPVTAAAARLSASGYLWRNQIDDLVAAGYQVAVPDQRGYGGSDKPAEVEAYDLLAAVRRCGRYRRCTGPRDVHAGYPRLGRDRRLARRVAVPATGKRGVRTERATDYGTPVGAMTRQENFGDNFVYPCTSSSPVSPRPNWTPTCASHCACCTTPSAVTRRRSGSCGPNRPARSCSTAWSTRISYRTGSPRRISTAIVADYRDGFRGATNWYRSIDRGIEFTHRLQNTKVTQPSHFMVGSLDPEQGASRRFPWPTWKECTQLRGNVVLEGAGHWLPLERPNEVNAALLDFLAGLERAPQSAAITKE